MKLRITWGSDPQREADLSTLLAWITIWATGAGRHCRSALRRTVQHDYCINNFPPIPPAYVSGFSDSRMRTKLRGALQELARLSIERDQANEATTLESLVFSWVMTIERTYDEDLKSLIRTDWRSMVPCAAHLMRIADRPSQTMRRDVKHSLASLPVAIRKKIYHLALDKLEVIHLAHSMDMDVSITSEDMYGTPYYDPLAGFLSCIGFRESPRDFLANLPPITRMRNTFGREALAVYFSSTTFALELDFTSCAMASFKTFFGRLQLLHSACTLPENTNAVPLTLRLAWRWPAGLIKLNLLVEYANMFAPGGTAMPGRVLRIIDASADTPLTRALTTIREALERASRSYVRRAADCSPSRKLLRKGKKCRHRKWPGNQHIWDTCNMIAWICDNHDNESMAARAACRELCRDEIKCSYSASFRVYNGESSSSKISIDERYIMPPPPQSPPAWPEIDLRPIFPPSPEADLPQSISQLASQSHGDVLPRPNLPAPPPPLTPTVVHSPLPPPSPQSEMPAELILSTDLSATSSQMRESSTIVTTPPLIPPEIAQFLPWTRPPPPDPITELFGGSPAPFPPPLRHPYWTYKGSKYPFEEGKAAADG